MRILALSSFNLILLVAIDLITSAALVSSAPSTSVMHRTTRHFARDDNHDMVDLGCYRDSFTFKILNGSSQTGLTDLTNDGCIQMCANQGFAYAGTENGDRCYCGSGEYLLNNTDFLMQTKVGICSKACSGNPHETCGGLGSIHVFGPPPSSNKWISRGCYSDWVDTIPDGFVHFSTATLNGTAGRLGLMGMTNWECKLKCAQSGFVFAGTEMGSECYCGNEIMNDGKKVGDDECNYQCVGDPTDQCGGYTRVSVFQLVNN